MEDWECPAIGWSRQGAVTSISATVIPTTATDAHLPITVLAPLPPSVITLIIKASPPFKLVVSGSNLQSGITGAIKSAVPKGSTKTFRFVNPDGGVATQTWGW